MQTAAIDGARHDRQEDRRQVVAASSPSRTVAVHRSSLTAAAELHCQGRMVDGSSSQTLRRFVQAIALDDPLRAHANVAREQAQRPLVDAKTLDEIICTLGCGSVSAR